MYKVTPLLADPLPGRPLTACSQPRMHSRLLKDVPRTLFSSQGHCCSPNMYLSPETAGRSQVCAPPCLPPKPCVSSPAGGAELLALSAKGRLMICHLDPHDEAPQSSRVTSAKAGKKIKQLLSGIGTVSER